MITREQVVELLSSLEDPIYKKSVTELQFIRDIMVKENNISLTLITSTEEEPVTAALKAKIESILSGVSNGNIYIRTRLINDYEKNELAKREQSAGNSEIPTNRTRTQAEMNKQGTPKILDPESNVKFIAVASGKGGVGKSTVTCNLAVALARQGKRVGIIDADIYGFSVPDMMGIEERPQLVDQVIIPVERYGVKVISMGFFVQDNAPIIWRGPMLGKMLRNFFHEVQWGDLDYMLLDLPPGTGDIALDVHGMIPQSKEIVVTTPHATAAFVAARAGAMAIHTNHEILGIVENMSYYLNKDGEKDYIFGRGGGAKLAEELHAELLAQIPLGAPDNHPAEPDYSPSVYKADTVTGHMYLEMAERIIAKVEQ